MTTQIKRPIDRKMKEAVDRVLDERLADMPATAESAGPFVSADPRVRAVSAPKGGPVGYTGTYIVQGLDPKTNPVIVFKSEIRNLTIWLADGQPAGFRDCSLATNWTPLIEQLRSDIAYGSSAEDPGFERRLTSAFWEGGYPQQIEKRIKNREADIVPSAGIHEVRSDRRYA